MSRARSICESSISSSIAVTRSSHSGRPSATTSLSGTLPATRSMMRFAARTRSASFSLASTQKLAAHIAGEGTRQYRGRPTSERSVRGAELHPSKFLFIHVLQRQLTSRVLLPAAVLWFCDPSCSAHFPLNAYRVVSLRNSRPSWARASGVLKGHPVCGSRAPIPARPALRLTRAYIHLPATMVLLLTLPTLFRIVSDSIPTPIPPSTCVFRLFRHA